jgi:hypothetical protein
MFAFHRGSRSRPAIALGLCCLALLPAAAYGQADPIDSDRQAELTRWVPALGFFGGVAIQDSTATIESPQRVDSDRGDNTSVFPYVGLDLELMAPRLLSVPGNPRLFVRGGGFVDFDTQHNIAREGVAGKIEIPDVAFDPQVSAVLGVGSATAAEVEPLGFFAGVGVAFTLFPGDRTLRIKPSFEYRYEKTKLASLISDAASIAGDGKCPCRTASLDNHVKQDYHSIGPGLEIELDIARVGPFIATFLARTEALKLLGNRDTSFGVTGTYDDGTPPSANSTYTRDAWAYNASAGIRLRWLPE